MKKKERNAIFFALLAAVLYAINAPFSKLLLQEMPATMMAALLYLGAGGGLFLVGIFQKKAGKAQKEKPLTKKDLPYTVAMVLLDIVAPIFLMLGLSKTTAANASLLNNFEIVATSLLALLLFKEAISKQLWLAIALVTASSMLLSLCEDGALSFSLGSLFVLAACCCWGLENNCTRMLSDKNPLQIVVIKGFFSGGGSLLLALCLGEKVTNIRLALGALLLGFAAYGLSIFFYIYAQRELGAAKTSIYYAVAPFIGVALSFAIFHTRPTALFGVAFLLMLFGTGLAATGHHTAQSGKIEQK